jgi:hypothetical protein
MPAYNFMSLCVLVWPLGKRICIKYKPDFKSAAFISKVFWFKPEKEKFESPFKLPMLRCSKLAEPMISIFAECSAGFGKT